MAAADFLGGVVAVVNLTPVLIAAVLGLLIALLVGAFVIVQSLQSGTWQVQLVPAPESADASVDASIPSDGLTPAAQSGTARLYGGYANTPGGGRVFSFLQGGGLAFDVHWSSVRPFEAALTMPHTLPSWTNPVVCADQCGHLAIAIPVAAPPGRPEAWVLNGGAEEVIDGAAWHQQHGELTLHGGQFYVILTDAGDVPAGATVTLKWLAWDGRGAAALPGP